MNKENIKGIVLLSLSHLGIMSTPDQRDMLVCRSCGFSTKGDYRPGHDVIRCPRCQEKCVDITDSFGAVFHQDEGY